MNYRAGEAAEIVAKIVEQARAMEHVAPTACEHGFAWYCNACTFWTHSTEAAEEHAIASLRDAEHATFPFAHLLYEREEPGKKARRRIHPGQFETGTFYAKCMAPPRVAREEPKAARSRPRAGQPKAPARKRAAKAEKAGKRPQEKGLL